MKLVKLNLNQVLIVLLIYGYRAVGIVPHHHQSDSDSNSDYSTPSPFLDINTSNSLSTPQPPDEAYTSSISEYESNHTTYRSTLSDYEDNEPPPEQKSRESVRRCGLQENSDWHLENEQIQIEWYPWLGVLHYPQGQNKRLTTVVVLVTPQLVITSAINIFQIPKFNFRRRSRVVLGSNCTDEGYGVLDYIYHPEYQKNTYSSLALVQIDVVGRRDRVLLRSICEPPLGLMETKFHAVVLPDNCENSQIELLEMDFVPPDQCVKFYKKHDLNIKTIWPTHTVCAVSRRGGKCLWKDGTVLMMWQQGRWHLMGFGVLGPGCGAVSRYVDYSRYHPWVINSVRRMRLPSITRRSRSEMIIRMTTGLQRYGRCDEEELLNELYTDKMLYHVGGNESGTYKAIYNLTLRTHIDYSCVIVRAMPSRLNPKYLSPPSLQIHSYCHQYICYQSLSQEIELYVVIAFQFRVFLQIQAYGRAHPVLNYKQFLRHHNENKQPVPVPLNKWRNHVQTRKFRSKWWFSKKASPFFSFPESLRISATSSRPKTTCSTGYDLFNETTTPFPDFPDFIRITSTSSTPAPDLT